MSIPWIYISFAIDYIWFEHRHTFLYPAMLRKSFPHSGFIPNNCSNNSIIDAKFWDWLIGLSLIGLFTWMYMEACRYLNFCSSCIRSNKIVQIQLLVEVFRALVAVLDSPIIDLSQDLWKQTGKLYTNCHITENLISFRYKPPAAGGPLDDPTPDYMNLLGMIFSMCGLMMKVSIKTIIFVLLYSCRCVAFLNFTEFCLKCVAGA